MDNDKPRYGLPVDFAMPPDLVALAEEARRLGAGAAATRPRREQSWIGGFDRAFSMELGRRGWLGMTWPRELGGAGRSNFERFVVAEALITAGAPIAATWVADRQIGPTLVAHGTREQQRRYLPAMIDGSVTWCIGMSEPDAGSDLAGLRTRAVADGADYVIEGRKIWTSFAAEAQYCYLIARTGATGIRAGGLIDALGPEVARARSIPTAVTSRSNARASTTAISIPARRLATRTSSASWPATPSRRNWRSGTTAMLSVFTRNSGHSMPRAYSSPTARTCSCPTTHVTRARNGCSSMSTTIPSTRNRNKQ